MRLSGWLLAIGIGLWGSGAALGDSPLADFSIFKSFYRPDVTIRWQLRQKPAALYRLEAILHAEEGAVALQKRSLSPLSAAEGTLTFDTRQLPWGRYAIELRLLSRGGEPLQQQTLYFPVLADPRVKQRLVTIRPSDNMLIVQGKPFFPIGLYESPMNEAYAEKLAQAGFNLCHAPSGISPVLPQLLDLLYAKGLHVWISVSHMMDFSQDAEKKKQTLRTLVEQIGRHPALLCWESIDEPAWGKENADGLYAGYCFLRALDQHHPIWTNHAPRNTIGELAHYNRATDIAGADIYPIPEGVGHSDLPNKTISVVGDETDKNRAAVLGQKPIFMVLQGFGWAELSSRDPQQPAIRPTFAQSRFMVYDAIVHGANGLLYWGTAYTEKPSRFWAELRSLVSELAALHDVLAAESVTGPEGARIVQGTQLRMLHKRLGRYNYLLLVNESAQETRAVIALPRSASAAVWRRLFEPGEYTAQQRRLTLRLAPYDVAVLSDNLRFAGRRKDFSAEWLRGVADRAALLTEPGNLLRNPGFEVDADEDQMPDEWTANAPLTASLSPAAYRGERSLRLQGLGGDMAPLAVQRSVPVQANRRYRFSAWTRAEGEAEIRFYVEWHTDTFHAFCLPWRKGSPQWQRLEYEFTATPDPQNRAYAVVQLRGNGVAYFDDLRLEELP